MRQRRVDFICTRRVHQRDDQIVRRRFAAAGLEVHRAVGRDRREHQHVVVRATVEGSDRCAGSDSCLDVLEVNPRTDSDDDADVVGMRSSGADVEYMFAQTSAGVTIGDDGRITLEGVSPTTLFFSDRPPVAGVGRGCSSPREGKGPAPSTEVTGPTPSARA